MANNRFNKQIQTVPEKTTGGVGVKPLKPGPSSFPMRMQTANWPGLPGKAGPDRSGGTPEEKVYAYAQGLRGGKEVADGDE